MSACARILVVEDDLSIREALVRILSEEGYEVTAAADGRRALALLRNPRTRAPDVIILDLMIPGMDGRDFRRQLLQDPALSTVPVLVLSASNLPSEEAVALQFVEVLRKPVRLERLLDSLSRVLAGSRGPGDAGADPR